MSRSRRRGRCWRTRRCHRLGDGHLGPLMAVPVQRLVQGDARACRGAIRSGCPAVRGRRAREAFEHVEVIAGVLAGSGTAARDHFLPFQCSASLNRRLSGGDGSVGADSPAVPGRGTADGAERADAFRSALPPGLGVVTRDHFLPFQCSAWFSITSAITVSFPYSPSAQQLSGEVHATSKSTLKSPLRVPAGVGVATRDQFLPFQCMAWSSWAPCLFVGPDRPAVLSRGAADAEQLRWYLRSRFRQG